MHRSSSDVHKLIESAVREDAEHAVQAHGGVGNTVKATPREVHFFQNFVLLNEMREFPFQK